MSRLHLKGEMMMNRRDFMKLSAASAVTMGAVAGMAPASFAENAGVHTDAEVQAMVCLLYTSDAADE